MRFPNRARHKGEPIKPIIMKQVLAFLKGKKTVIASLVVIVLGFIPGSLEWLRDASSAAGVTLEQALAGLFLALRLVTSGKVNLSPYAEPVAGSVQEKVDKLPLVPVLAFALAIGSMGLTSCNKGELKDWYDDTRAEATVVMGDASDIPEPNYRVGVGLFGLELGIYGSYSAVQALLEDAE